MSARHLLGVRLTAAVALAQAAMAGSLVGAQTTFHVRPLLSATEVHDSNIFSTSVGRQADLISRVSPGLESDYRSTLLTLTSRYAFDVERFARHDELSTMSARQHGTIAWGYRPTPRLALTAAGDLLTTRTPGELNVESGLTVARERAQRATAQSSLTRQLSPVTAGTMEYSWTEDRLERGFKAQTHAAAASTVHRLSPRDSVNAVYRFREFKFGSAGIAPSAVTSHSLGVGWTHAITRRVTMAIGGGPRVTGEAFGPELSASIHTSLESLDLSLAYGRTQTTIVGVNGAADIQNVTATAAWTPRRSLQVRMTPSFFRNAVSGRQAEVYMLAVGVRRPISSHLSVDVTFDGSVQRGNLVSGLAGEIARRSVAVRLVALDGIRPY
jgi:hypothetical protein